MRNSDTAYAWWVRLNHARKQADDLRRKAAERDEQADEYERRYLEHMATADGRLAEHLARLRAPSTPSATLPGS